MGGYNDCHEWTPRAGIFPDRDRNLRNANLGPLNNSYATEVIAIAYM